MISTRVDSLTSRSTRVFWDTLQCILGIILLKMKVGLAIEHIIAYIIIFFDNLYASIHQLIEKKRKQN